MNHDSVISCLIVMRKIVLTLEPWNWHLLMKFHSEIVCDSNFRILHANFPTEALTYPLTNQVLSEMTLGFDCLRMGPFLELGHIIVDSTLDDSIQVPSSDIEPNFTYRQVQESDFDLMLASLLSLLSTQK